MSSVNSENCSSTIKYVFNTVIRMMMAMVFFFIIYLVAVLNINIYFSLHIIFSLTGYQFLMMEAIMAFDPKNSWNRSMDKKTKRLVHIVLLVLASTFIIIGFAFIVDFKSTNFGGNHFTSTHGIFGLISFILTSLSIIGGITTALASRKKDPKHFLIFKIGHTSIGMLSVIFGLITLILGINKDFSAIIMGETTAIIFSIFIALSALYVTVNPFLNIITTIKTISN